MKKIIIVLLIIPISVFANSFIVFDSTSNNILYGQDVHEKRLIASTSKIMTAIIAIENGDLTKKVVATKDILSGVGSSIYMEVGEELTLEDLLYGMMLRSGNDAAIMVALSISPSMEDFAKLMNDYAKKLNMNDSNFINSHGLEDKSGNGNASSAYDMAILTTYALKNEKFKQIFGTKKYTCKSNKKEYYWTNKNKLLKENFINGGKTGYTKKAGRVLVTSGVKNNIEIVIVSFSDPDDFNTHKALYKKVEENYERDIVLYSKISKDYYLSNDIYLTYQKSDKPYIKTFYYIYKNLDGKIAGSVKVILNDKILYEDVIYKKEKKKSFFRRLFSSLFK